MTADDDRLKTRLAEMMSSAGLGYNQISLEILYLLPDEFIRRYIWLWEKALGPAGGGDSKGRQMASDAELGKAETQTRLKGQVPGAGGGGQGKKFKKIFVIRDEKALDLKGKMDKRLRSMARDIRAFEIGLVEDVEDDSSSGRVAVQCTRCGKIMSSDFRYCPYDGSPIQARTD